MTDKELLEFYVALYARDLGYLVVLDEVGM